MPFTNRSNRILQPAKPWFVYLSLFVALMLNYMNNVSFSHFSVALPDWVALVLVFWCIREPLHIGMGAGFILGVLVDIGLTNAMGQHALAYVVLAYLANSLARRVMWFPALLQALHVLPLLLLAQALMLGVQMFEGSRMTGWWEYFLPSAVGAVLWLPLTYLLLMPQFQPLDRDDNRPI